MARGKRRRQTNYFDSDDEDLELLSQFGFNLPDNQLPPGVDSDRVLEAIDEYGDSAYFLDEMTIEAVCGSKALDKGKKLIAAGQLVQREFDGAVIAGTVADHNRDYRPSFDFDLTRYGCDCSERSDHLCSHIAALMWAWSLDHTTFLPARPSQDQMAALMDSPYGNFLEAITGEYDYGPALAKLRAMQNPAGAPVANGRVVAPSLLPAPGSTQPDHSTGAAFWPLVTSMRVSAPPLTETLEAEFNTSQLRELAKWLGVKLKGTAKSGFIEQVAAELNARVARMRAMPEVILEGLADEHATFARRLFTARDYELPLPRNLANALWLQQTNKDPDKRLADLIETLRRRALLFPARLYFGYRDVYYQWLPLTASAGNVPLAVWPARAVVVQGAPHPTITLSESKGESKGVAQGESKDGTRPVNFLDAFDLFIGALLSTGTEVRATLPAHPKTASTVWLRDWEHSAEEAERLLNSRPGWVPNPQSGLSVPLLSPLTAEALARLENQTGLPGSQCEFLFAIACALQLVEAPDPLAASSQLKGTFKPLPSAWHVNARTSAIEEWFALTDEDKFLRAWNAWREKVFFGVETRHAVEAGRNEVDRPNFQVMRAIGARDFTPNDLAAEWCGLRRYLARTLRGLPANEWISWPEFRKLLFEFYPDCAWVISGQDHWWFGAPGKLGKLDPTRPDEWRRTIGAILEVMLAESLQWFGVVEVDAPLDGNGLQIFRLTEVHAWLAQAEPLIGATEPVRLPKLPASATPRPRLAEPVTWLDDRHWRLPPAPDRAEFIVLARKIAEPTEAAFTYALTPASVERALSLGIGLDDVERHFESFAAPMPESTRALFKSIADRFGRVRVYESLTVLQLGDDYALRELLANTSLAQHIVYQISPRAVVVRAEAVDALMEEMVARGYTPALK